MVPPDHRARPRGLVAGREASLAARTWPTGVAEGVADARHPDRLIAGGTRVVDVDHIPGAFMAGGLLLMVFVMLMAYIIPPVVILLASTASA